MCGYTELNAFRSRGCDWPTAVEPDEERIKQSIRKPEGAL